MPSKKAMLPADVAVGFRVKEARIHRHISQMDLGELLGITWQQVQKYEKGVNRISAGRLHAIAQHLNLPITYFFEDLAEVSERPIEGTSVESIKLAKEIDAMSPKMRAAALRLIRVVRDEQAAAA